MKKLPKTHNQKQRDAFAKRFLKELKKVRRKKPTPEAPIMETLMRMK